MSSSKDINILILTIRNPPTMFEDIGCPTGLLDFDLALTSRERAIPHRPDQSMDIRRMIEYALEMAKTFLSRKISPFELNAVVVNSRIVYTRSEETVNNEADVV